MVEENDNSDHQNGVLLSLNKKVYAFKAVY